jgi:hypothetical protein
LRRIISLLAVMMLMAAIVAASAMPAFAAKGGAQFLDCERGGNIVLTPSGNLLNHCGSSPSTGGGAEVIPCPGGNVVVTPSGNTLNHCHLPG